MLKKILFLFLAIVPIMTMSVINTQVYAENKAKITICSFRNRFNGNNIKLGESECTEAVKDSRFEVFNMGDISYDKVTLDKMSIDNLEKKFGKGIFTQKTGEDGVTEILNLDDGTYYILELDENKGQYTKQKNTAGTLINVDKNKNNIVYMKSNLFEEENKKKSRNHISLAGEFGEKKDKEENTDFNDNKVGKNKNSLREAANDKGNIYDESTVRHFEKKFINMKDKENIDITENKGEKIIKTGDKKIFYILGFGLFLIGVGSKVYGKSS